MKKVMKQASRIAVLTLVAGLSFSACSKKKSNEPTPTPPPINNGGDNNGGNSNGGTNNGGSTNNNGNTNTSGKASFTVAEDTNLTIKVQGQNVKINGESVSDGAVKNLNLTAGQSVSIEGEPTMLDFGKGKISKLDLSSSLPTLTKLKTTIPVGEVNLSGATNLQELEIAQHGGLKVLDLTKHSKLTKLELGNKKDYQSTGIPSITVTFPATNNIEELTLIKSTPQSSIIDFASFTKLRKLVLAGNGPKQDLVLRNMPNLQKVDLTKAEYIQNITLENNPQLTEVELLHTPTDKNTMANPVAVVIKSNPNLSTLTWGFSGNYLVPAGLTKIDLSGNGSIATYDGDNNIFASPNLVEVDLSGTVIDNVKVANLINMLPQAGGKKRVFKGSILDPQANTLTAKGWTVNP